MIIVKLQGGLGNQMFQYAIAKSLATHYETGFALDHHFLMDRSPDASHVFRDYDLGIFQLRAPKATRKQIAPFFNPSLGQKVMVKWLSNQSHKVLTEPFYQFFPDVFNSTKNLYLDGYWQSEKYFAGIKEDIKNDFNFKQPVLDVSLGLLHKIQASESVCLNVRRTDFLSNSFHAVCSMAYYDEAIRIMKERIPHPSFFVFSDDKDWCRAQFAHLPDVTVVDAAHNGEKYGNYLQLMIACRHFIIPNSTFGWWAAWLSQTSDTTVIVPTQWFTWPGWETHDLIPGHWIQLPPL